MSRIADYVKTLSPTERLKFADLIRECADREAQIASGAARARAALTGLQAREREFRDGVRELAAVSARLKESVTRLYLVTVPPQGRVS